MSDDKAKPGRFKRWFQFEPATAPTLDTVAPQPAEASQVAVEAIPTPSPLMGEGWGGGEAPVAVETAQQPFPPPSEEPVAEAAPPPPPATDLAKDIQAREADVAAHSAPPPQPQMETLRASINPARGEGDFADVAPPPQVEPPQAPEPKRSWLRRLKEGLSRSSSVIGRGIVDIFTKRKLDATSLDDLEDILIQADLGLGAATRIRDAIGKGRYEKGIDPEEVKRLLAEEVERTLAPIARPLTIDATKKPFVILVVGVNGSGKTTTIGKLAAKFVAEGKKVTMAAGDTFRAAAIEQLKIWASRTGSEIVARDQGGDAAGLAFDALTRAKEHGADVVLMDTAGRLQNRTELMGELEKIIRVMKKVDPEAPHATLLVLDATVGQNALSQVEIFGRIAGVTGLVMTKLDGTARGGILVAIADKFSLPVHFIGVGETVDDLEPFAARDFARAIAGLGD